MRLPMYGDTSKSWESIISFYRSLADHNRLFNNMAALAARLAESPYRAAGLCALTSMHDLKIGPTMHILDNPHLIIKPDFEGGRLILLYEDGSAKPWSEMVKADEAYEKIVRVITKYAHWYSEAT